MPSIVLWLVGAALLVGWGAAGSADIDRADATGGTGSILAGVEWLVAALTTAAASVLVVRRRALLRRPAR